MAQTGHALAPNYLSLPDNNYKFDFYWQGDSAGNEWKPHAALLLPVTLPGCSRTFYLQFDLGAPSTVFYKNKLHEIHSRYPQTRAIEDSTTLLRDYRFRVGNMPVRAEEMTLINYASPAIDWRRKNAVEIIGTVGADFIDNRVLMIDYPSKQFHHRKEPSKKMSLSTQWSDFIFVRRTVLLPAVIEGKKTLLFFDTGSSAYELLTNKETAERLAKLGAVAVKHASRSWNRTWMATTLKTEDSIIIANQSLPLRSVTYMEGVDSAQAKQMMKMGIGGMTGNELFSEGVLILDTRSKKFTVLKDKR